MLGFQHPPPLARIACLLLSSLLLPSLAGALPAGVSLTIVNVDRTVDAQGTSFCPGCGDMGEDTSFSNGETESSSLAGLFDEIASSVGSGADQTSLVSTQELSGEGSIGLGFTGFNEATSVLDVDFQVSATGTYGLLGGFDSDDLLDTHYIELSDPVGTLLRLDAVFGAETFAEFFQLQAGTVYTLHAEVAGFDFSGFPKSGSWSFALVPEPATGLLVAAGLVGLGLRRRALH